MKRRPMSKKNSRTVFKRGTKQHPKNGLPRSGTPTLRGGIRL